MPCGGSARPRVARERSRTLPGGSSPGRRLEGWSRASAAPVEQGGAVKHDGQRPCRDVLDEARQQATEDSRPRQGWLEPRVGGAEDRAVLHVERDPDGSPVVATRKELAQDL